eukprot:TRINITY_DN9678_c0_g1_i2.p1 TRINITY_DN9678_c0_g1~~TRINITY_DN9678_c0_g1_i2.p1  ORF type:complete len:245 (-),score=47.51 TRINITY_DN9678_c0_g1_i2:109-843(-)
MCIRDRYIKSDCHSNEITSIHTLDDFLVTTSRDSFLKVWAFEPSKKTFVCLMEKNMGSSITRCASFPAGSSIYMFLGADNGSIRLISLRKGDNKIDINEETFIGTLAGEISGMEFLPVNDTNLLLIAISNRGDVAEFHIQTDGEAFKVSPNKTSIKDMKLTSLKIIKKEWGYILVVGTSQGEVLFFKRSNEAGFEFFGQLAIPGSKIPCFEIEDAGRQDGNLELTRMFIPAREAVFACDIYTKE